MEKNIIIKPYVEYQVISIDEEGDYSKINFLKFLKERKKKIFNGDFYWITKEEKKGEKRKKIIENKEEYICKNDKDPILHIESLNYENFEKAFTRLNPLFETLLENPLLEDLRPRLIDLKKKNLTQHPENKNKDETKKNNSIYLILEVHSNYLEVIKKNYYFLVKAVNFFNWGIQLESTENSIILFYQTKEDFLDTQVDHLNRDELIKWIKKRGLYTEYTNKILDLVFHNN